ncbi:hypothetical protein CEXT_791421 [Caerostris extrusa]|uniref:Uncharacterized protein n=1 Tax=Caerostris extrusa TaxID=172846 RepID=A0AAV4M4B6_CAEEX|nr:hypothetical protein CEXT_791421 [Caerostris extrusa]
MCKRKASSSKILQCDIKINYDQPYKFGYSIKDKYSEQHRDEISNGAGDVKGSYGYVDAKGVYRKVEYVADKGGFRAEIKTNEPGTANQDPAYVKIKSNNKYEGYGNDMNRYQYGGYGNDRNRYNMEDMEMRTDTNMEDMEMTITDTNMEDMEMT